MGLSRPWNTRWTPASSVWSTRRRHVVHFKAEQVGKTAFYMARWQTARGHTGPWGLVRQ